MKHLTRILGLLGISCLLSLLLLGVVLLFGHIPAPALHGWLRVKLWTLVILQYTIRATLPIFFTLLLGDWIYKLGREEWRIFQANHDCKKKP